LQKKSIMKKILPLLITLSFLLNPEFSRAQAKIGYISPDEVLAVMPEVKKADTALILFQQELSKAYQDQQNELNDAYEKFVKDSATMTPTLKDIKRKDLQDRVTALGPKEQDLNKALDNEKEKLLAPIREKLLKAIKEVAKENGYGHILYKEQAIVFPAADDITSLVKKKLGIK